MYQSGAGSLAVADTMIVYSIAPRASRVAATCATVAARHPADERLAHWHLDDLAGGPDLVAFFDALIGPEDDRADRILLEVEGDAADPALEFEQLEGLCTLQAVDLRDPVADLGDDAHG